MAKAFLMCGRICSGKSTHARELRIRHNAVILSVDEITLALFGQDCGEKHDDYVERLEGLLYKKAVEIIETGTNVILDWGFWTRQERDFAKTFFAERDIQCEFHYINLKDSEWKRRLVKRNRDILENKADDYYIDEGLAEKFSSIFEQPERDEIEVWIEG